MFRTAAVALLLTVPIVGCGRGRSLEEVQEDFARRLNGTGTRWTDIVFLQVRGGECIFRAHYMGPTSSYSFHATHTVGGRFYVHFQDTWSGTNLQAGSLCIYSTGEVEHHRGYEESREVRERLAVQMRSALYGALGLPVSQPRHQTVAASLDRYNQAHKSLPSPRRCRPSTPALLPLCWLTDSEPARLWLGRRSKEEPMTRLLLAPLVFLPGRFRSRPAA
jgi:hypothetical protein